jgi:glucosyl-dolichyl phosphate glucuronosyltransferase
MPFLSIVIATYNRAKFIGTCLECLAAQTLPVTEWDVIIVDNNCTDNTAQIVKDFIEAHPHLPFRYYFEATKGVGYARNRGMVESDGEIVVYIDDDVEVKPDYLQTIYDFLKSHPQAAGMGGRTLPKFSEGPPPPWYNKYMVGITGTIDRGLKVRKFGGFAKYPCGCNMAYRRDLLLKTGGFNPEIMARADDKYVYEQVAKLNDEVWYVPDAFSLHNIDAARLTDANFERLYTRSGKDERIKNKGEGAWSVFVKGLDFIAKVGVSIGLWVLYALKGRPLAGRYIFLSQWYVLKGFFS